MTCSILLAAEAQISFRYALIACLSSCDQSKFHDNQPPLHCRLLCEVHEEYETNIKLAKAGYFVYDFALPLLLLHAFTFHTSENIANWLRICPRRQITVLDTHDGMGIDDISGLASVSVDSLFTTC